jgi:phage terminase Nu1 subunit (DNA packaging protein)
MLRDFKRLNHCEPVRKHANGTGSAQVEVEELSFNCVEHSAARRWLRNPTVWDQTLENAVQRTEFVLCAFCAVLLVACSLAVRQAYVEHT